MTASRTAFPAHIFLVFAGSFIAIHIDISVGVIVSHPCLGNKNEIICACINQRAQRVHPNIERPFNSNKENG